MTAGRRALRRPHHVLGAGAASRCRRACGTSASRSRTPASARPPTSILVAPATARLLAAYAIGLSTDLLTNILLATRAPVVVCPAMHTEMWEHPAVQDNLATLRRRGVHVVEPDVGRLAGGDVGAGRLAAPERIVAAVERVLGRRRPRRAARRRQRRRHPRADRRGAGHRQPQQRQAGLRDRRRGRRPRRATSRSCRTVELPVPAGVAVRSVETAAQMQAAMHELAADGRRRRDGGSGRRLPSQARRCRQDQEGRRRARDRARADARHPRRARAPRSPPVRPSSGSPPRPSDLRRQRHGEAATASAST